MSTASAKKTDFYERLKQKQANQAEIKEGFSFSDKEIYEAVPLARWLDKSGHPELPVEKTAESKILFKKDPVPLDLFLRSLERLRQEYKERPEQLGSAITE